jgi:hypothetical protein
VLSYNVTVKIPACTIFHQFLAPCLDRTQTNIQPLKTYKLSASIAACEADAPAAVNTLLLGIGANERSSATADPVVTVQVFQCRSFYQFHRAVVTRDQAGKILNVEFKDGQIEPPVGFQNNSGFLYGVLNNFNGAGVPLYDPTKDVVEADLFFSAPLTLNDSLLNNVVDDPDGFLKAVETSYSVQAATAASAKFMMRVDKNQPCRSDVPSTITSLQQRLMVSHTPTYIIESLLGVAIIMAAIMLIYVPGSVTNGAPDSLAHTAAVIRKSSIFEDLLRSSSILSIEAFRSRMTRYSFRTTRTSCGEARIEVSSSSKKQDAIDPERRTLPRKDWYLPLRFKAWCKPVLLLLPLVLICALEVLLHASNTGPGICNIEDSNTDRYAWLYIPTSIFWLVKVLYASLAIETLLIEPYYLLATRPVRSGTYEMQQIMQNNTKTPTGIRLLFAIAKGRITVVLACMIGVITPFLTIFSAGLFTNIETYNATSQATISAQDWFSPQQSLNRTIYYSAPSPVYNLLPFSNLSFPRGVYDTFAFPQWNTTSKTTSGKLYFSTPAYRARVRCYNIEDYSLSALPDWQVSSQCHGLHGEIYPDCLNLTAITVLANISTLPRFTDKAWSPDWSYASLNYSFLDIAVTQGPIGLVQSVYSPETSSQIRPFQEFWVVAASLGKNRLVKSSAVQVCRTGQEILKVDVGFDIPSLTVTSATANEASATWWANSISGQVPYPAFFDNGIEQTANRSIGLDRWFNAMVYSRWGVPFNDLVGNSALLSSTVERFQQIAAAQYANTFYRLPLGRLSKQDLASAPITLNTTLYSPSNRLVQAEIPTRILDGLLAMLFICTAGLYWNVRYKEVIPRAPGSLGTAMSLLAGHSLDIPEGMDSWTVKEMQERRLWAGENLSLRMRNADGDDGSTQYRIDRDGNDGAGP